MEILFFAVILAVILGGFWIVSKKLSFPPKEDQGAMLLLQNQLQSIDARLEKKLDQVVAKSEHTISEVTKTMRDQFSQSSKIIEGVTEKLTRVDESAKQTLAMNEQIKKLQDTLTNPKQRGILGEYYLETILKNVLPPGSYQMQYPFEDNVIVDAVVFVNKHIIPIDSKFSLENYNRFVEATDPAEKKRFETAFVGDIKNRIDETSKYVKPESNTMGFAFMFIPSEAIWYDLLVNKVGSQIDDRNLIDYANQKHVTIVSPTSFLAHLQTVLQGLNNQKISEQAEEIVKEVARLGKHLVAYEDYFLKVGKNLGTTVSTYKKAHGEFRKIDKDVLRISGESMDVSPLALEGMAEEDSD